MSHSTHTETHNYLGAMEVTTDEESDSSKLLAITNRIDQIAKVSKNTISSFSALVLLYSNLI